ncbi:MAG: hypothetical protein AMXMBFR44_5570 [Candidatus Campbellbacteria bacterium]
MFRLIGMMYEVVGRLLLRRTVYICVCDSCGRGVTDQCFPYHGAFPWEREYWVKYQPEKCYCGHAMTVKHSFEGLGGALYRLPGYKAYSDEKFRRLLRREPELLTAD